jgi:hypothetical protein
MYEAHIKSLNFKLITVEHVETLREQLTLRIANITYQQEW